MGALLLIALVTILGLTRSVSGASETIRNNLESVRRFSLVATAIRSDLSRAQVASVAEDGSAITYSLPVPLGPHGGFVDGHGNVVWGVNDTSGGTEGGTITLSFVVEETVSESTEGRDINGDGDEADVFDRGRLVRTSSTDGELGFPPLAIYVATGDPDGDVDGDGMPDPIFQLGSGNREVLVTLARAVEGAELRMTPMRCTASEL